MGIRAILRVHNCASQISKGSLINNHSNNLGNGPFIQCQGPPSLEILFLVIKFSFITLVMRCLSQFFWKNQTIAYNTFGRFYWFFDENRWFFEVSEITGTNGFFSSDFFCKNPELAALLSTPTRAQEMCVNFQDSLDFTVCDTCSACLKMWISLLCSQIFLVNL